MEETENATEMVRLTDLASTSVLNFEILSWHHYFFKITGSRDAFWIRCLKLCLNNGVSKNPQMSYVVRNSGDPITHEHQDKTRNVYPGKCG